MTYCEDCFSKQRKIDELTEEVSRLKTKLKYEERRDEEGYFGSSTPSSKIPVKASSVEENQRKRGGAKPGQPGHGRYCFDQSQADHVVDVGSEVGEECPDCGGILEDKGADSRSVIDIPPLKAQKILYLLPKRYCSHCRKTFKPRPQGVLPRSLYGNQLVATAAAMHYLHGIPLGRICEQMGIGLGSLIEILHRMARLFANVPGRLIEQYRQSPVKHADETGWRNDGHNGYAWLFATDKISIFLFRKTRSASVPKEVFGTELLPGTLVVDRYNAYNKAPSAIQYCYAHLLREVEDKEKEFGDNAEVKAFVDTMAPLLSTAMSLRGLPISDDEFYRQAAMIESKIKDIVRSPATHLAIRRIQDIFCKNEGRLYHWASDRRVPAENNRAERDLRPTVIARKVSFGSQSDAGAKTREVMMTVLQTLKKRSADTTGALKNILDQLAKDIKTDPFNIIYPANTS